MITALINTHEITLFILVRQVVGFHRPGSIRLLQTPERMNEAKYQMSRGGWHKAPMSLLSPDEVHEMVPYMKMDGILGGLITPGA